MAKKLDVSGVVEKILEEPWEADDLLEPLSAAEKTAVKTALLASLDDEPTEDAISALAAFIDDKKVLAALGALVDHEEEDVARGAIEELPESPATAKLLVPKLDAIAKRGDDLLMLAAIEKLAPFLSKDAAIVDAFARHWDFAVVHDGTLMASNALYDALIEHAPKSKVAIAAFEKAAAHAHEYLQVRGHAALAIVGIDRATHIAALKKVKSTMPSTSSLRKSALKLLSPK